MTELATNTITADSRMGIQRVKSEIMAAKHGTIRREIQPEPDSRVRDIKVNSGGATGLPVVFGAAIEMAAAEGDDGVGTADGPEHAGLFEAAANDGLTPGFDNAGTDEKVLTAELGITHAAGVFLKVIGLLKEFFGDFRRGRTQRTQEPDQLLDLALIEFGLVAQYPFSLMGVISWVKETSQVPEMLAGVK